MDIILKELIQFIIISLKFIFMVKFILIIKIMYFIKIR